MKVVEDLHLKGLSKQSLINSTYLHSIHVHGVEHLWVAVGAQVQHQLVAQLVRVHDVQEEQTLRAVTLVLRAVRAADQHDVRLLESKKL